MIHMVLDGVRKILIPDPEGSRRVDWIVKSAQAHAEFTPALVSLGEKLYAQLEEGGHEHRVDQPLVRSKIVRSGKNLLSRRRTKRVYLNP